MTSDSLDLFAVREICRDWPNTRVPESAVIDGGVLERLRQILLELQRGISRGSADLVPLIRQVLLRHASDHIAPGWLCVPTAPGWPEESTWLAGQFNTDPTSNGLNVSPRFPRLSFLGPQADLFDDAFRELPARPEAHVDGDPLLQRSMHLPTYTGDGQREAVRALLHLPPGETLIANLPTGSGKSLLAQLPPLLNPEGMLTLAIVPTVALALDQAHRMQALLKERFPHRAISLLAYHSGLSQEERSSIRRAIRAGEQPILFTSPESATGSLRSCLEDAAGEGRLSHVMIDEAHLVTGWGNGFRPVFQLLPALVQGFRRRARGQPLRVVLASATLSAATLTALRQLFGPPKTTYLVAAVHLRSEPRYAFQFTKGALDQFERVMEAIQLAPRPFILYVTRPEEAISWLKRLREAGHTRIAAFTGRTPSSERDRLLREWAANELDGMVATSAFGLGVDKNDVRAVLHATLPESLDRFYQEVGRSGRDGRASASLLVHTDLDIDQARGMASQKVLRDNTAFDRWTLMITYAHAGDEAELYWVDLRCLPPHLTISSEQNLLWNVRTLTLMARAEIIELVALRASAGTGDEAPIDLVSASQAAVRILDSNHLNLDVFSRRITKARDDMIQAGDQGIRSMQAVASLDSEISEELTSTYSAIQGIWSPVTTCCGGCATHWDNRSTTGLYQPPLAGRLRRFAARSTQRIRDLNLPMASAHLLVIAVPDDNRFLTTCERLATYLASAVRPHTWLLACSLETSFAPRLRDLLRRIPPDDSFIDIADARESHAWVAGSREVRVIFIDRANPAKFPSELWSSEAELDIVIVPNSLGDPDHELRQFIATTRHVAAATFLDKISS
ncbi:MAG: protein DpdF [Rhodanobacter sp.]